MPQDRNVIEALECQIIVAKLLLVPNSARFRASKHESRITHGGVYTELLAFFRLKKNHTAFKLNSLWHAGHLRNNLGGFYECSRVSLLPYSPARRPNSIEPPQLLGFAPSYFSHRSF